MFIVPLIFDDSRMSDGTQELTICPRCSNGWAHLNRLCCIERCASDICFTQSDNQLVQALWEGQNIVLFTLLENVWYCLKYWDSIFVGPVYSLLNCFVVLLTLNSILSLLTRCNVPFIIIKFTFIKFYQSLRLLINFSVVKFYVIVFNLVNYMLRCILYS